MKYSLKSGVEANRAHPFTFLIPEVEDKAAIRPGDCVKLIFTSRGWTERMWVLVTGGSSREGFEGTLVNNPVDIDAAFGDEVRFGLDHIIDIEWEE